MWTKWQPLELATIILDDFNESFVHTSL
jgi:hypothetical protein